jgi:hypothetical protein
VATLCGAEEIAEEIKGMDSRGVFAAQPFGANQFRAQVIVVVRKIYAASV